MLSKEDNEILTQVGAGTPMGELLRRYWMPACLSSEVAEPDGDVARVRLLGEHLVAFRDSEGKVGVLDEECPHRGASMFFARNEECGLRCIYHGWKFDVSGQCVDQPSEIRSFADRIKIRSYPAHESGGIVWTYLGAPETMTPFRDFGTEGLAPEEYAVSKEVVECNWVQSLDGEADTTHISNLHQFFAIDDIPDDGTDEPGYPSNYMSMKIWRHDPKAVIEMTDHWYGFRYAGIRRTPNGHRHVRMTAFILPTTALIANVPFGTGHIMHAPIDDGATTRYTFASQVRRNPKGYGGPPFFTVPNYPYDQGRTGAVVERDLTAANNYGFSRELQKTRSFSGIPNFKVQDNLVTETAGRVYDRTHEHLGSGDVAVIRLHQRLLEAAKALQSGGTPPALSGQGDFRSVRSAEKILAEDEDWRILGTDDDPAVQEAGMVPAKAAE